MNKVLCESCGKKKANAFGFFLGRCMLVCDCTIGDEEYYIEFKNFFRSKESEEQCLRHIKEKRWFNENDFMDKLEKLRKE